MSRVFVRIHCCWGSVAVSMVYGTGHGPSSVWKIVACLSLLLDFDPIAVVPNGGHVIKESPENIRKDARTASRY